MKNIQPECTPRFRRWQRRGWAAFASLHRRVTIGVLAVGMSILLLATPAASAHEADTAVVVRSLRIDEVGIAGSRSVAARPVQSQTPLYDRSEAAAAPLRSVEEALRLAPSVDVRERGKGMQADISVRGSSFDQTMVLLNGIDFTDARTGHQSHALPVDLECVSEIRLLEGVPGVGAYAGAVDIRTQLLRPRYLRLDASGGHDGYAYAHLSGAHTARRFQTMAAASYRRSDGYRHNTDYQTCNAYLSVRYDASRAGYFDLQAGYQYRTFGSNGFYALYNPDQWERTATALASLRWLRRTGPIETGAAVSYRKNFDRYDWTRGTAMNRHATDHVGARLWAGYDWRAGRTTVGGDYAFHRIFSTNLGEPLARPNGRYTHSTQRHTGNLWLRHAKHWRRFDAEASLGASLTPYGETGLWSVAAGYRPAEAWRLEAGLAQSMRLPTFTDLYYTSPAQVNNPNLKPERAVTARIGAAFARGRWDASTTLFYRLGRGLIDWVWHEQDGKWHAEQANRMNTFGAEFSAGYTAPKGFLRRLRASYAYIVSDRRRDIVARSAMDYLRHKAVLSAEVRLLKRVTLTATATVADRNGTYTDYPVAGDASVTRIRRFEPYFRLDARLQWEKGVCRIWVDAANLTDAAYCDLGGLPMPGFRATGGVTLLFGR